MLDMGLMARFWVITVVLGLSVAGLAQVPKTVLVEPPTPLLFPHVAGWDLDGEALTGQDAAAADGANAEVLKEDGLKRFAKGSYKQARGTGEIAAYAMQFVDATGAYAAYTFYRAKMGHARELTGAAKLGDMAAVDGATTLVLAGTAVLQVQGAGRELAGLVTGLVIGLPKVTGRAALRPLLPTYVPQTGLQGTSVRYALGPVGYRALGGVLPADVLEFGKSGEALTAEYAGKGGKGTLTLLLYPTPQIAGDAGRGIEKALNVPGIGAHGSLGTVKLRRVGPLLGVTTGGFTTEQAEALVQSLHLDERVSFDQKMPLEFHAEVHKTATLLQNILAFCGVLAVASLLLGVFLWGMRAGWRVMRGKSATSDPEFLTIDLRGQSHELVTETVPAESVGGDSGGGQA